MKVLFAVSNEEISESIIKKYQKEYKQIISYKNVYYFNAILKELQKDKSYDRVVISEDLEAFSNTQYDQIDKFIFEKLDSISDEAANIRGNDIPIILICSDRRNKGEEILVKLFGIGVYNAIIGNDRSVDEVCRLINRPRAKKEAKSYYKIDSENVNYQSENENDVSEVEIQNIIAHYRRLGKNEDRYVDSFNNIAAQYNDTQLRIITKFLPLNVRAVLEERSPKYQKIMSFNSSVSDNLRVKKQQEDNGPTQVLLKPRQKEKIMSSPVVIPSSVNLEGNKKLTKPKQNVVKPTQQVEEKKYMGKDTEKIRNAENRNDIQRSMFENIQRDNIEKQPVEEPPKKKRGRPRKNPVQQEISEPQEKKRRGRPRKNQVSDEVSQNEQENIMLPGFDDYDNENENTKNNVMLPGFDSFDDESENNQNNVMLPGFDDYDNEDDNTQNNVMLPGFDDYDNENQNISSNSYENDDTDINDFQNNYSNMERNTEPEDNSYNNGFANTYDTDDYDDNNSFESGFDRYENSPNVIKPIIERDEEQYEEIDLSNLLTPDKKIVTFLGTSKNGTSFIVNNIAALMSSVGVNTAILDTTGNRNSYYIYTKNEEDLRKIGTESIEKLSEGIANGIKVNNNLTVYTSLPSETESMNNVDKILETLLKNHSLILIDSDFGTPFGYFKQTQELYLVQTFDILTIQPLTKFLRELKGKNILDERKIKVVLNKSIKIRGIKPETIIGGMAFYNDPAMSYMTELFDRSLMKYISIPFDEEVYVKYLEALIDCEISLKGYSKTFIQVLNELGSMVYPMVANMTSGGGRNGKVNKIPNTASFNQGNSGGTFSKDINDTLNRMKNSF